MKLLLRLILIAVLAFAGWYFFFNQENSTNGAALEFQGPDKIFLGVPFELRVGVSNNSQSLWRDVKLSAFFNKSLETKTLGSLGEGSLNPVSFQLLPVGDSEERAEVVLSYSLEEVDSRFEKREFWVLPKPEPAVTVAVSVSEKIVSGQELEIKVDYENVSQEEISGLFLRFEYPAGFNYKKADPEPDQRDNFWELGNLRKGSAGTISVFGNLNAKEESVFNAALIREVAGVKHVITEEKVKLTLEESPLSVGIILNETEGYTAKPGETLFYAIGYTKKPQIKAKQAIVQARLLGSMFDLATLKINEGGSIQPGSNEIVWRQPLDEDGGSVTFSIATKSDYAIRRLTDRNFTIKLEAEVEAGDLSNKTDLETKVAGQIKVEAKAFFYDAASGILNRPSQYTIHWLLINTATDVKEVEVRASLAPAVTFTSTAKSNLDSKPTIDTASNSMVWKINRISAGSGLFGQPIEGIFQIQLPSTNYQVPTPLLGETTVTAVDDFTGANLTSSYQALTTSDVPQQ